MLEFDCKEDRAAMRPTESGHFCGKCQHEVIDFTNWDRRSLLAYLTQHPDTCGQYRPDQLEPELVPLSDLLSLKTAALVAGLTLGSIQVSAQASDPISTEQTIPTPSDDVRPSLSQDQLGALEKPDGIAGTCPRPVAAPVKKRSRRHHLYVSSRFPFFFVRRARRMGRIRRGRIVF